MPKVLTYHDKSDGEHWFSLNESYTKKHIDAIKDPEQGALRIPPTSIPSPFAQMDLVKTAFRNVSQTNNLTGTPTDLRLISHCFDVGELFFNHQLFQHKVQIITWRRDRDLKNLLESPNDRHRRLGEVLELYLTQDADAYNFNDFSNIYLIQFDNDPQKVVGGTSPSTLFFSSNNDLKYAEIPMPNNHILFGSEPTPLHHRDDEFQLFLYAMQKGTPDFAIKFKWISEYLDKNKAILSNKKKVLYDTINNLQSGSYESDYEALTTGKANKYISILNNLPLKSKREIQGNIESDFEIRSEKYSAEPKPLVLAKISEINTSRGGMKYYTSDFKEGTPIPYFDPRPIKERTLPGLMGIKYPCIFISDFFEPHLIRLVYPMNNTKYFDGNLKRQGIGKNYLLPIKKEFFNYFNVDFLVNGRVEDGRPVFEMENRISYIKATLRIPIRKGYITFERNYKSDALVGETPDASNNKGIICENRFDVTIFPFVQLKQEQNHLRVLLVDRETAPANSNIPYQLSFFENETNKEIKPKSKIVRNDKTRSRLVKFMNVAIYALERNFDYCQLNFNNAKGLIIPKFGKHTNENNEFHFAIDFGTTNTHIEYKTTRNTTPLPFEISEEDLQMATLSHPDLEETEEMLDDIGSSEMLDVPVELFPTKLGAKHNLNYPHPTVLSENRQINFDGGIYPMADITIPLTYGKTTNSLGNIISNLKWSNYSMDSNSKKQVRMYFESLMLMIRAKILLNNGNLDATQMTWFYPSSMMKARLDTLTEIWKDVYKKYITDKAAPVEMLESLAPFYYYQDALGVSASYRPVVAIDIGGGTSDVVIYENDKPISLTSFKYAANTIFGDGFSKIGKFDKNGFVQKYATEFEKLLENNALIDLLGAFSEIKNEKKSVDFISFLFSLENDKSIIEQNLPISFSQKLKEDENFKIIFVTFYVGLIYHIAKLMKAKGIGLPRYLTFSGNGSRILELITPSEDTLEELTKIIFEKVYAKDYHQDGLEIKREKQRPKEATCKGGLMAEEKISFFDVKKIKGIWLGANDESLNQQQIKYSTIDETTLTSIVAEFASFIAFLSKLNKEFNFYTNLNVSPKGLEVAQKVLQRDIMTHLKQGFELRKKEITSNDSEVNETLFFYPLIASLPLLAQVMLQVGQQE